MSVLHIWLLLALLGSAIAVVMTQHEARSLYIRLHEMQEQTRKLEVEHTELQLAQSTLSANARVESVARERLGMVFPAGTQVHPLGAAGADAKAAAPAAGGAP
ncbi:MAG: cell division protein FtsL [Rhodocyclaceae bacterium]|nr:cell division protein FtsL [Rhodocyclaceae bacterium]